jgi:D-alanine-D-alanine ligase
MKVLVLAGGTSDEREVSLRSGAAVAAALQTAGHDIKTADPADGLDEVTVRAADVVFPVLHGLGGEDGALQQQLEAWGVRYAGSDSKASALCFDKWAFRQALQAANLPTAPGTIVTLNDSLAEQPLVQQPFVLKPIDGGSSVDTYIVRDVSGADWSAMQAALDEHQRMLLEKLITGTEITVGVLGEQVLPVIEIIPPANGEFDFTNKYNGQTRELCPPENVDTETQVRAQELALKVHDLCGCRDMSRTDIIIDTVGQLWVLEINTIPGMTDQSLLPKAAATAGINMPQLVDSLVQAALAR